METAGARRHHAGEQNAVRPLGRAEESIGGARRGDALKAVVMARDNNIQRTVRIVYLDAKHRGRLAIDRINSERNLRTAFELRAIDRTIRKVSHVAASGAVSEPVRMLLGIDQHRRVDPHGKQPLSFVGGSSGTGDGNHYLLTAEPILL